MLAAAERPDQADVRAEVVAVGGEHRLAWAVEGPERIRAVHIEAAAQRRRVFVPQTEVHLDVIRHAPVVLKVIAAIERR